MNFVCCEWISYIMDEKWIIMDEFHTHWWMSCNKWKMNGDKWISSIMYEKDDYEWISYMWMKFI